MARKKHLGGRHSDEGGHGDDRPWVYFMIDAFFLVTQFFVITFKVKSDEVVLPQRLPPGGTSAIVTTLVEPKQQVNLHVTHAAGGQASYNMMSQENTLAQLNDLLASAAATKGPEKLSVRISYDGNVPFADVMAVFNTCNKVKIAECGLIPLRRSETNH